MPENKKKKKEVAKNNSLIVQKKETKKKASPKSSSTNYNQIQAIQSLKDVPLNELYEDLNSAKAYRELLEARRDELLRAKAINDAGKRRIAIQKANENTVDIEFKYQKNQTFKNHYIPKGEYKVYEPEKVINQQFGDRVMQRSVEHQIAPEAQVVHTTIQHKPIVRREVAGTMEHRQDRVSGQMPAPAQHAPIQREVPQQHTRSFNAEQMRDRGVAPAAQPQPTAPMPMPVPMQQPQMMMQQPQQVVQRPIQPQQQPVQPQPQPQPQQPVQVQEPHKRHKLWPLYERIEMISKTGVKQPKVILSITIVLAVIFTLALVFLVLWGFASEWKFGEDIGQSFSDWWKLASK